MSKKNLLKSDLLSLSTKDLSILIKSMELLKERSARLEEQVNNKVNTLLDSITDYELILEELNSLRESMNRQGNIYKIIKNSLFQLEKLEESCFSVIQLQYIREILRVILQNDLSQQGNESKEILMTISNDQSFNNEYYFNDFILNHEIHEKTKEVISQKDDFFKNQYPFIREVIVVVEFLYKNTIKSRLVQRLFKENLNEHELIGRLREELQFYNEIYVKARLVKEEYLTDVKMLIEGEGFVVDFMYEKYKYSSKYVYKVETIDFNKNFLIIQLKNKYKDCVLFIISCFYLKNDYDNYMNEYLKMRLSSHIDNDYNYKHINERKDYKDYKDYMNNVLVLRINDDTSHISYIITNEISLELISPIKNKDFQYVYCNFNVDTQENTLSSGGKKEFFIVINNNSQRIVKKRAFSCFYIGVSYENI